MDEIKLALPNGEQRTLVAPEDYSELAKVALNVVGLDQIEIYFGDLEITDDNTYCHARRTEIIPTLAIRGADDPNAILTTTSHSLYYAVPTTSTVLMYNVEKKQAIKVDIKQS